MKRFTKFLAMLLVLTVCMSIVAVPAALAEKKVKITGDCNLRKGPGLGYKVIRSISKGKTATYLGSSKKDSRGVRWYKVKYSGKTGWVSSRLSKLTSSGGGSGSSKKVKATGSVHVRTSPSRHSKILGSISSGTKLTYRGKYSRDSRGVKWYAVTFNGKKGWVSSVYSKLV